MKILLLGVTHPTIELLNKKLNKNNSVKYLHYRKLDIDIPEAKVKERFNLVISLCPIWEVKNILVNNFIKFSKIIVISSTSIFSKLDSLSFKDRSLSQSYLMGEKEIIKLCEKNKSNYTICRTTMLWGFNYDKNISKIIRLAKKFHFLPYPYPSSGLRAPIHFETLTEFLYKIALNNNQDSSEIIILSGRNVYKLNQIFKIIAKKYKGILIPVFVPTNILLKIYKIFKFEFFNSIAGFSERSSNDLDFHEVDNYKTIFVEQINLKELI